MRLARLDRPVGTLLLLWPTLAGVFLASGGWPDPRLLAIFALGTIFMRSAGCVMNDILDRHHDGLVERTRDRPLPLGDISVHAAMLWFAVLAIGSLVLALMLKPMTLAVAAGGMLVACIYPLMKRYTYLPQVVLGIAFSWGLLMAYVEVEDTLPRSAWVLFTASLLWIVAYDTWYAMVDRDDDLRAGIKSTAILFGTADRLIIGVLQGTALGALILFGLQTQAGLFYYLGVTGMAATFLHQHRLGRRRDRRGCFHAFTNNVWTGFLFFAGVVLDAGLWPWVRTLVGLD
ncbi:MAG: 4-hydroxybenzoate octaprenyltransferase [Pseudomonadales bacterium]